MAGILLIDASNATNNIFILPPVGVSGVVFRGERPGGVINPFSKLYSQVDIRKDDPIFTTRLDVQKHLQQLVQAIKSYEDKRPSSVNTIGAENSGQKVTLADSPLTVAILSAPSSSSTKSQSVEAEAEPEVLSSKEKSGSAKEKSSSASIVSTTLSSTGLSTTSRSASSPSKVEVIAAEVEQVAKKVSSKD